MAKKKSGSFLDGVWETFKTLVYALLLAGLIRTLLFQPFWIPSGSMKPALLIGDFLFVNKFAYGYSAWSCPTYKDFNVCGMFEGADDRLWKGDPERGDVVVFRHPVSGQDYIKRLIGTPGDQIAVRAGQIILNGTPVPQVPDGEFVETYEQQGPQKGLPQCRSTTGVGGDCIKDRAIETLPNGVSYEVLDIRRSSADDFGPVTVPEGHYFFMGDNRDNSVDSRYPQSANGVGFVPFENLIGRADRIMFSSAGASILYFWTWRGDRFLRAVN